MLKAAIWPTVKLAMAVEFNLAIDSVLRTETCAVVNVLTKLALNPDNTVADSPFKRVASN